MADQSDNNPQPQGAVKDPEDWATGDEAPTESQMSYLQTLSQDTGEEIPEGLTKGTASELIDRLRGSSPRVDDGNQEADGATGVNS